LRGKEGITRPFPRKRLGRERTPGCRGQKRKKEDKEKRNPHLPGSYRRGGGRRKVVEQKEEYYRNRTFLRREEGSLHRREREFLKDPPRGENPKKGGRSFHLQGRREKSL